MHVERPFDEQNSIGTVQYSLGHGIMLYGLCQHTEREEGSRREPREMQLWLGILGPGGEINRGDASVVAI